MKAAFRISMSSRGSIGWLTTAPAGRAGATSRTANSVRSVVRNRGFVFMMFSESRKGRLDLIRRALSREVEDGTRRERAVVRAQERDPPRDLTDFRHSDRAECGGRCLPAAR